MGTRYRQGQGMSDFFSAGGYGFYLWMSYAAVFIGIAIEILGVRARFKRALQQLRLRREKQ